MGVLGREGPAEKGRWGVERLGLGPPGPRAGTGRPRVSVCAQQVSGGDQERKGQGGARSS